MMQPACSTQDPITAVVLAGGKSRRMGGTDKGLLRFAGRPLARHVIDRVVTQVDRLLVNANRNTTAYRQLGFSVIGDELPDFPGPLSGLLTALDAAETPLVLTVPCDTPLLPHDLAGRLREALVRTGAPLATVSDGERIHPTVLLARKELADSVRDHLESGGRRLGEWVAGQNATVVDFSDCPDAFTNINTPQQFLSLERGFGRAPTLDLPVIGFVAPSGTGKTTLLEQVIGALRDRGLRLAVIKHTHHRFDIDRPGKDSHRFRGAGAEQVMVASRRRWALMTELRDESAEPRLGELLPQLDLAHLDLVLVEGFKHEHYPKIEVYRPEVGRPPLFPEDEQIIAVATNDATLQADRPLLDINDPERIAVFLMDRVATRSAGWDNNPEAEGKEP